ncbi:5-dehydro-4-deoxy-D-glucuronate isomerase [Pelagicoccus sp. SDUM812002]|uniref:5-dehydro-4-deoxy-D-glucuronate isomerase n=1 Tax=Pelagicoccus sp. SDUM812002 TaxID=3041266 RepID=UPI00280FF33E|nr:5-dehydro-4-deoxy-D-glucuronate isomerase [Pelagicoccus sp. SDUM812002]MDQ8184222.1 5-dehydro-4-deoxy-D-glucuronate isomerase [Pelagicoccus sp. SDUM812002]
MSLRCLPLIYESNTRSTDELRSRYLLEDLFQEGEIKIQYCDLDRVIVGGAFPKGEWLGLKPTGDIKAEYFCERRELGVINLGELGVVTVDGQTYELAPKECLYVGRGAKSITFDGPAGGGSCFYFVSYPAHREYPTKRFAKEDAKRIELGSSATANERVIYQYIHESGTQSCQLVLGYTEIAQGSVWNTMPPHTHDRRSEVYLYLDVPGDQAVMHFMGQPQSTRHLCVGDKQAVLSPAWSIHAGCGTANYSFVWAMGGENQRFDDMDPAPIASLR